MEVGLATTLGECTCDRDIFAWLFVLINYFVLAAAQLSLDLNMLTSTLPTQLGQLSLLGKYSWHITLLPATFSFHLSEGSNNFSLQSIYGRTEIAWQERFWVRSKCGPLSVSGALLKCKARLGGAIDNGFLTQNEIILLLCGRESVDEWELIVGWHSKWIGAIDESRYSVLYRCLICADMCF